MLVLSEATHSSRSVWTSIPTIPPSMRLRPASRMRNPISAPIRNCVAGRPASSSTQSCWITT